MLTTAIFKKSMKVKGADVDIGNLTTLFSADIQMIERGIEVFAMLAFLPFLLFATLFFLFQLVGSAMFVGFGFVIILMFPIVKIFGIFGKLFDDFRKFNAQRIKILNEALSGIRIIKFYGWEKPFEDSIQAIRLIEKNILIKVSVSWIVAQFLTTSIPAVLPVIIYYFYYKFGNELDLATSIATIMYLGILQGQINMSAGLLNHIFTMIVSIKRILNFLNIDESPSYVLHNNTENYSIIIENANLGYTVHKVVEDSSKLPIGDEKYEAIKSDDAASLGDVELTTIDDKIIDPMTNRSVHTLLNINFSVKKGQLVAIVGGVGSGKTSFLNAILGELLLKSGSVEMNGTVSYHQQTPWILNATVRDNILFGEPYDEIRFNEAMKASCLDVDIKTLENGLMTEIGEKGINLSGGQKARISFARCFYRNSDIYLLDDPLSAVDAHVGKELFEKGISIGLCTKTVLLVTHQVQFLKSCDHIVVLDEGKIKIQGSYDFLKHEGIDIESIIPHEDEISKEDLTEIEVENYQGSFDDSLDPRDRTSSLRSRTSSGTSRVRTLSSRGRQKSIKIEEKEKEKEMHLMSKEEMKEGKIPFSTYGWFFSKGGNYWIVLMIIVSLGGKFSDVLAQYKLTDWNKASLNSVMTTGEYLTEKENMSYIGSFAILKIVLTIAGVFRYSFACSHGIKAGQRIHKELSHTVLSAPIAFFDTTPQGRILNRFSVDIGNLDNSLAPIIAIAISAGCEFAGAIGAMLYSTGGSFIFVLVPFMYFYYLFQVGYSKTNIQLKRLESNYRSPVLSQFTELINGLTSVRAFDVSETFRNKMTVKVEDLNVVDTIFQYSQNWIQIRFDMLGGLIIFALYALTIESTDFISPSDLAVGQLYAQSFSGIVSMVVILLAQIQSSFNSVERVKEYIHNITPEETDKIKELYEEIRDTWPENGKIVFNDIDMGYRDGPSVLKGLTFSAKNNEKIGIVGRTGSGKSTVMIALFRIESLRRGTIFIDDVDISTVPLSILRSKLGIIPQDPVMFQETLRFNIDPFNEHNDNTLWKVLEDVKMNETVSNLPGKLNEMVLEGGSNFSAGQRQLICFARAILRNPKILVLDEATASVDNDTDTFIQSMIKEKFVNSTTLTIAHRINTIIDSDRILVLDQGKVAEYDTPTSLIAISNGIFKGFWDSFTSAHEE